MQNLAIESFQLKIKQVFFLLSIFSINSSLDSLVAIITKLKGEEKIEFPLAGVRQIEKIPLMKDSNSLELAESVKIKIHYLEEYLT